MGEIQKINLIRGIGVDSEIFLFDEAEASLDNNSKDYLLSHLGQLKRKINTSLMYLMKQIFLPIKAIR